MTKVAPVVNLVTRKFLSIIEFSIFGAHAASDDKIAAEELASGVGFMSIKHLSALRDYHHIVPFVHVIVELEAVTRVFHSARDVG